MIDGQQRLTTLQVLSDAAQLVAEQVDLFLPPTWYPASNMR
ncbi:hypothetical protein [Actinoallomurus liliacearum]